MNERPAYNYPSKYLPGNRAGEISKNFFFNYKNWEN